VAINAFDEPKPRVKGIVGYTGKALGSCHTFMLLWCSGADLAGLHAGIRNLWRCCCCCCCCWQVTSRHHQSNWRAQGREQLQWALVSAAARARSYGAHAAWRVKQARLSACTLNASLSGPTRLTFTAEDYASCCC
jgi:hypothetical protein